MAKNIFYRNLQFLNVSGVSEGTKDTKLEIYFTYFFTYFLAGYIVYIDILLKFNYISCEFNNLFGKRMFHTARIFTGFYTRLIPIIGYPFAATLTVIGIQV